MRGVETIKVFRSPVAVPVDDLDDATSSAPVYHHDETGCIPYPRTSTDLDKGEVVLDGQNVFIPAPVKGVLDSDEIEFRGERYSIQGVPADYRLRGRQRGVLLVLDRVAVAGA